MGELHLEVVLHRLRDEFRVESHTGKPRVSYKEAIRRGAAGSGKLERTIGGKDLFAVVHVEVIAGEEGAAAEVEWAEDCPIPESDRPAVAEALEAEAQSGPTFGFPLVGARVRVVGAEVREKSEELAFVQAATLALRQALQEAEVVLLEPVMAFEVDTPEDFASGIIADLGGRQAEVGDVLSEGDKRTIRGKVPMIQMFGYSTVVRSLSQGRASFSLAPAGFTQVAQADLEARGLVWT
jgi:elongation factor G